MFYVGQKVVCVETWKLQEGRGFGDEVGPVSGAVYTIREIGIELNVLIPGLQVRLEEIINPIRDYHQGNLRCSLEVAFRATRFRPLVERDTDISIFKRMLNPEKVDG